MTMMVFYRGWDMRLVTVQRMSCSYGTVPGQVFCLLSKSQARNQLIKPRVLA
jgi:hypothetical protein